MVENGGSKILFVPCGDIITPSTRIRCYLFAEELSKRGFKTKVCGFRKIPLPSAAGFFLGSFYKFLHLFFYFPFYDVIYFQKTAYRPHWPIFLFYNLIRRLGKKIVFDIDDALFLGYGTLLGPRKKSVDKILKMSNGVIVGSHFLFEYTKKLNQNVFLIPTPIDLKTYKGKKRKKENSKVTIGWIGVPFNIRYLKILSGPLKTIGKKHDVRFKVITDLRYSAKIPKFENVEVELTNWSLSTFLEELNKLDIGVMPLYDDEWSRGKCAYKVLEYMSLGIPAVASAVGENNYVIKDGANGFLARNEGEWISKLSKLIENEELRKKIGENGRRTVEEIYSLEVNGKKLAEVLKSLVYGIT
jgi:glycosyltransferase involved in cell wall biosynthesis